MLEGQTWQHKKISVETQQRAWCDCNSPSMLLWTFAYGKCQKTLHTCLECFAPAIIDNSLPFAGSPGSSQSLLASVYALVPLSTVRNLHQLTGDLSSPRTHQTVSLLGRSTGLQWTEYSTMFLRFYSSQQSLPSVSISYTHPVDCWQISIGAIR